jgi:hypothetical protein
MKGTTVKRFEAADVLAEPQKKRFVLFFAWTN